MTNDVPAMQPEVTSINQSSPSAGTDAPQWYIDEKTPGVGSRPEWLPSKYQRLSDVEKARSELEKKLGAHTGAPEKYDIASLELDESDPTVQALVDVGKKHGINQEAFNEMLGRLVSVQETERQIELEQAVAKLGKDGERQLTEFKNWKENYLKPEEREQVTNWVKTPEDLQVFNKMMAHTHMSAVPTHHTMNMANNFESVKDLKHEMKQNIEKYRNDATYRKDWSNRMAYAVARNPNER